MKKRTTILALIASVVLLGAGGVGRIDSDPKDVAVSPDGRTVVITGRWESTAASPSVVVPRVNSVRVECGRDAGDPYEKRKGDTQDGYRPSSQVTSFPQSTS